ncbi:MAG: adenylate/guanylate cyclase domain-containing protein [Chitinophagaceae bacterium]
MFSLSAEYKIKWNKVLTIIIVWMIIAVVISIYDHIALHSKLSRGTPADYSFFTNLVFNIISAFIGGILGGGFLVFFVNEKLRSKPYWMTVLFVAISFILIVAFIAALLSLIIAPTITGKPLIDPETRKAFSNSLFNSVHLKNIVIWSIVVALTQLTLQINDKFGQGILWNFIKGRYNIPREETRIFMFVDLISSTTIAEKLGNEKYHLFLRDFYADITNAIIYNKGEIYQYVGDEIVISWKLDAGIANNQCLKCYFDMRKTIMGLKEKYESKYEMSPDFKAGLHYGKVIAGEIGIIKRDITFSGDVLNTASRIQSKCNEYKVKILSSDELLQKLPYENQYKRIQIGDIELKGKETKVPLSTLEIIEHV